MYNYKPGEGFGSPGSSPAKGKINHICLCTCEKAAENDAFGGAVFGTLSTRARPARLAEPLF